MTTPISHSTRSTGAPGAEFRISRGWIAAGLGAAVSSIADDRKGI